MKVPLNKVQSCVTCVVGFVNHSCLFVDVNAALLFHISNNGQAS